jgi:hypothetical protein
MISRDLKLIVMHLLVFSFNHRYLSGLPLLFLCFIFRGLACLQKKVCILVANDPAGSGVSFPLWIKSCPAEGGNKKLMQLSGEIAPPKYRVRPSDPLGVNSNTQDSTPANVNSDSNSRT